MLVLLSWTIIFVPDWKEYMQLNFLTDSDILAFGTISENQLILIAALAILGLIVIPIIVGILKKKNEPHIKTTIKENI